MEQEKDIEKLFVARFIDLWMCFNSGKFIGPDIRTVGIRYYKILSSEDIDFKTFNRICNSVEKDFNSLGYDFNLAAYVLDCVRAERAGKMQIEDTAYSYPIELPTNREPIEPTSPSIAEAIRKLKTAGLYDWVSLLERINAKRIRGGGKYAPYECEACRDTGWIPMAENSVATCTCKRGQRFKPDGKSIEFYRDGRPCNVKQATIENCKAAASDDICNPILVEAAPF
jgi:hypothetical protein